jgi:protein TonB
MHLLLLLTWSNPPARPTVQQPISVSFLPAPPPAEQPVSQPLPRLSKVAPTRPSKAPAIVAQKSSPLLRQNAVEDKPISTAEAMTPKEPQREEPAPPRQEPTKETPIIAERSIPTLRELLPPVTWSSGQASARRDGPIRLDTKNPQYVTYFGSIKRDIELVWEYPEQALRYGLQGKLLLEFSIVSTGELESAKILRSSGSHLLDQEALRAVKAAAPFRPIPPWIDRTRIDIIASFEYLDNRLHYRFMP